MNGITYCRQDTERNMFGKKMIIPEEIEVGVSDREERTMLITITGGKKKVVLDLDKESMAALMAGIMDVAPAVLGIENETKKNDVMYA